MKKIPPKRKTPSSYITFVGKKLDLWEHADFTNRMFPGLIDLSKAKDIHGDIIHRMNGIETYTIANARIENLCGFNYKYVMVVTEFPSRTIWVMKPNWIRSQNSLRGKVKSYSEILDALSLEKVAGGKIQAMLERNELIIDNQQIDKK